jgi:hypothetical protein
MVLVNQAEPSTRKLISVPPLMPPSIDGRFPFSHFLKELRPEWSEAADRRKVQNSLQTFNEALVVQGIAGTQKASWTTAVTVIPATSLFQFPPNYFQINKALRFTIAGSIGNVVTAQPTFTFQVMIGGVAVFTSGAVTTTTTAHTNIPFWLDIIMTCRAVGSGTSANFMGQGKLTGIMWVVSGATADLATTHATLMVPNTAPAAGAGFDSTIAATLDFFMACGTSNAGNTATIHQYIVEALN